MSEYEKKLIRRLDDFLSTPSLPNEDINKLLKEEKKQKEEDSISEEKIDRIMNALVEGGILTLEEE